MGKFENDFPQMTTEHEAWKKMCEAFELLALQSVNEKQCQPLVSLIRLWGEELAILRRDQGDDGIKSAGPLQ